MTTLICNTSATATEPLRSYDLLTDEHSASSYGRPVLIHDGQPLGPADMYDEGLFGARPAREVEIRTNGLLTDEQLALLAKWRSDCAV